MIKLNLKEKRFDDKIVLKHLNITISNGEVLHIVGDSGIGKTTLMRILTGIDTDFNGVIVNDYKKMSITFPERVFLGGINLFAEIKVLTNASDEKINTALFKLGLSNSKYKYANQLSTGMKSRASVIRALLAKSEIVFLDEPLLGLDENTKIITKKFITDELNNRSIVYTGEDIFEKDFLQNKIFLE